MRRFNTIIESANPPGINQLWIDKKKLRYFTEGKWHLLGDGGSNPPEISDHDTWIIDGVDTGKPTRGEEGSKGDNGLTPFIGTNKHWWIGTTDTGVVAEGTDGIDGDNGLTPQLRVTDTAVEYSYDGITWTELIPKSDFVINYNSEIYNNPDEEDITVVDEKLKFKDKPHSAATFSGLGRVYLRKNVVGDKNVLTQDMINQPNTIYHIQYDYDLNGGTIIIPSDSVLDFAGGSISNGTIRLKNKNTILQNGKCYANIVIGLDDSEMDDAYNGWFSTKFNIILRNMELYIESTKDLGKAAQSYMNTLTDDVLEDDSSSSIILQNVIGVNIENCNFVNPIIGIRYKSNADSKRQSVARINVINCRIKDCYCAYYANGVTASTDFGDTSFIGNELFTTKYGVYVNRQDGLVLSGNTIYTTRVLDSTCLRISNTFNLNINGNQLFGGLVGIHILGGEIGNIVSIVGNGLENQGVNRWDSYDKNIGILLEGLSLNDRCTISGNVLDSYGVRKYVSIKDSTMQTLFFTGNSLNLRSFGIISTPSDSNFGASAFNVCDPFEVINSTIYTCNSDRYYYTNQVGKNSNIVKYNFYSLNRNDSYGKKDIVKYGVTGYIPVVKYNPVYTFVIDIYLDRNMTFNTSKTWRYAVDTTIIDIPVVANVTTLQDIYHSLFNQAIALEGVSGYNDLEDNGCIYLACKNGIKVIDDDYRVPMQVVTGGFDADYSNTQNFYCNSVEDARVNEANYLIGRYSITAGSNQDKVLTINNTVSNTDKKIAYLKDTFLFVGYSNASLENLISKIKAIIDAGIYSDKLSINTLDNSLTIKADACNGFSMTVNNLFTTINKSYANSGRLNRFFIYDSLSYPTSDYPSVDRGRYVLDAVIHRPVWFDSTRWIESDGAKSGVTRSGQTLLRPELEDIYTGFMYFDTSLNKPYWWNGSSWITYPDSGGSTMAELTFTGAVEATYNGSTPVTVNIPTGGGGTTNYEDLSNKPKIGDVELVGTKTLVQLGIQPEGDYATNAEVTSAISTALTGYATQTYVNTQIQAAIGVINTTLDEINGEII